MGCGKSKQAVATDNAITKGKGKNPGNNLPVAKPELNENVKGYKEKTGKTNGEVAGGTKEESSKPGTEDKDVVTIPGNENKKSIEEAVPEAEGGKVEESRTNEVVITGNEKEEIVPVVDIKEETGKEVIKEAGDIGNGKSEISGKEIEHPGSGESGVKLEAAEEKKEEIKKEESEATDVAVDEEKKDESNNEESKAANVAVVENMNEEPEAATVADVENEEPEAATVADAEMDESKNEESKAANVTAVEEKKEEIKNEEESKAENKDNTSKTQEATVSQDSSSTKDHEAGTVEAVVSKNDVSGGEVEGNDAKDGKPDDGEDNSGKGTEEAPQVVEIKENVTADETKSPVITGADETSATRDQDATTATTTDAKEN